MKRSMLIGFAACAFVAMPAFSVSAMPIAPAHSVIGGTDSSAILVKGGQYKLEEVVGYDVVMSYGGKIVRAEMEDGFSTTNTIASRY